MRPTSAARVESACVVREDCDAAGRVWTPKRIFATAANAIWFVPATNAAPKGFAQTNAPLKPSAVGSFASISKAATNIAELVTKPVLRQRTAKIACVSPPIARSDSAVATESASIYSATKPIAANANKPVSAIKSA